jgi:hypothetical protein
LSGRLDSLSPKCRKLVWPGVSNVPDDRLRPRTDELTYPESPGRGRFDAFIRIKSVWKELKRARKNRLAREQAAD